MLSPVFIQARDLGSTRKSKTFVVKVKRDKA